MNDVVNLLITFKFVKIAARNSIVKLILIGPVEHITRNSAEKCGGVVAKLSKTRQDANTANINSGRKMKMKLIFKLRIKSKT